MTAIKRSFQARTLSLQARSASRIVAKGPRADVDCPRRVPTRSRAPANKPDPEKREPDF
jgi:hypothetical protein